MAINTETGCAGARPLSPQKQHIPHSASLRGLLGTQAGWFSQEGHSGGIKHGSLPNLDDKGRRIRVPHPSLYIVSQELHGGVGARSTILPGDPCYCCLPDESTGLTAGGNPFLKLQRKFDGSGPHVSKTFVPGQNHEIQHSGSSLCRP